MMLSFVQILAQAAPGAGAGGLFSNPLIPIGLMLVMLYMLMIRPQQAQQKALQQRLSALQKGDQVVTNSGIYGLVHNIKETTIVLKVAEATMVEFEKGVIARVIKKDTPAATDSK